MNLYILETGSKIFEFHHFVDAKFNESLSSRCTLVLQKCDTIWICAAWDPSEQEWVFFKSIQHGDQFLPGSARELVELKSKVPEISFPYQKTRIIFPGKKQVLIPLSLYREDMQKELFQLSHPLRGSEKLCSYLLKSYHSCLLYALDLPVIQAIEKEFPGAEIIHTSAPLLENISLQFGHLKQNTAIVFIDSSRISISVMKNGKLAFHNIFSYKTREDFIYYLLFTSEQLELNTEEDKFYFAGFIYRNSELYKLLYRYIKYPIFTTTGALPGMPLKEEIGPGHLYYTLFGVPLCE